MARQEDLDQLYMDIASRTALMSHAVRAKVGAVLVHGDRIISYGWNGTPSGDDNSCEVVDEDGTLRSKPEVLHAELNCLLKLTASGGIGSADSTLYVTMSPCTECAKLIKQAKIRRIVFRDQYRDARGITFLMQRGVQVEQLSTTTQQPAPSKPLSPPPPIQQTIPPSPNIPEGSTPSRPAKPMSILQAINPEVSRLRSQITPPPLFQEPIIGQASPVEVIGGDVDAALAAAGLVLVNGIPVQKPTAGQQRSALQDAPDDGYRSSFL